MTDQLIKDVSVPFPPLKLDNGSGGDDDNYAELKIFPAFVDYDFFKIRPRGCSSRIDFFSFGKLTESVEKTKYLNSVLYIKKPEFMFKHGFFLMDFIRLSKDITPFIENVRNLKFDKLYIEKSSYLPLENIVSELSGIDIFLLEFV